MVNMTSSPVTAVSELASARRDWLIVGAALAIGACAFGYIFRVEVAMAVRTWSDSDAFNHCFLVLPVAAYLAWERRQAIVATLPAPAFSVALLAIPVAAAWFAADRLGILEGRQLTAMTLFQIMVLALVGFPAWRRLATPLLYLYFLVPFGEFLVPPLQNLVAHFASTGLTLLGVPTYSDGIIIEIPQGTFLVHQACSGMRFLIASAAFGVLYSCIMYTSPLRRVVFSLLALALAVVGNCFRVLGTILIAHFWGNIRAVETDHVLWGWGFYVIIGAALILIGFRFRQEPQPTPDMTPTASGHPAAAATLALAAIVFFAAVPRVAADYLDRLDFGSTITAAIPMPAISGCTGPTAAEREPALHAARTAVYNCDGNVFRLAFYRYPPRMGVRPLFVSLRTVEIPAIAVDTLLQTDGFRPGAGPQSPVWRITQSSVKNGSEIAVATALWLNGQPSGTGIGARVQQALNSLRRASRPPVLAAVTYFSPSGPNETRRAITAFLARTGGLSRWVDRWLAMPPAAD